MQEIVDGSVWIKGGDAIGIAQQDHPYVVATVQVQARRDAPVSAQMPHPTLAL